MAVAATPFSTTAAAGIAVFLLLVADGVFAGRGQGGRAAKQLLHTHLCIN